MGEQRWRHLVAAAMVLVVALSACEHPAPGATTLPHAASEDHSGHGQVPDRLSCTGYPEPRVFLESQAWWRPGPGSDAFDAGHLHVGACFPYAQRLRGAVDLDVRVILHENPGRLQRVQAGIVTAGNTGTEAAKVHPDLTCPEATCEHWFQLRVDTTKAANDGRAEFRLQARVLLPNGKEMFPSTGWPAFLDNGKARGDHRGKDVVVGRGWYSGAGYQNADLTNVPTAPVSEIWEPEVKLKQGADGRKATSWFVLVDPAFHHEPPDLGIVIGRGDGGHRGTMTIDTRKLSDGPHRLVLRTDAAQPDGAIHSALLVVPFTVRNHD